MPMSSPQMTRMFGLSVFGISQSPSGWLFTVYSMEEPSGSPLDLGPIDRAGPAYGSPSPSPAVGSRPLGLSAKSVRHVSGKVKAAVYREYRIVHHASGEYEVDHLISLELGGSNDIRNLWPESYRTEPWNAHVKDKLEDRLHALVCAGKMSLPDAQKAIAGDWKSAYRRWVAN
jgi:hypothetical protein